MIRIDVTNAPLLDYLERLTARLEDLGPAMGSIGMELENRIRERFEARRDPLGTAWAEWSPATVENYPKDGERKLLERYGDMLGSLNHRAGRDSVSIGFGQPYAAYHEFGTKHMPRRGLLFADPEAGTLAPEDEQAVIEIIEGYLSGEFNGGSGG